VRRKLLWAADTPGDVCLEIAHVEVEGDRLRAEGTQIGIADDVLYELRYVVAEPSLRVEIVGGESRELELEEGRDHFDVAFSPLFNSLPVLRHGLHRGGSPRDFVMTFVSVPDLGLHQSTQRYDPLNGEGRVRFSSGTFQAEIEFDADAFVVHYPTIATRLEIRDAVET
jgi:hypothetical protein